MAPAGASTNAPSANGLSDTVGLRRPQKMRAVWRHGTVPRRADHQDPRCPNYDDVSAEPSRARCFRQWGDRGRVRERRGRQQYGRWQRLISAALCVDCGGACFCVGSRFCWAKAQLPASNNVDGGRGALSLLRRTSPDRLSRCRPFDPRCGRTKSSRCRAIFEPLNRVDDPISFDSMLAAWDDTRRLGGPNNDRVRPQGLWSAERFVPNAAASARRSSSEPPLSP